MTGKNPYTISFGKVPTKYLSRRSIVNSIIEEFERDMMAPFSRHSYKRHLQKNLLG